MCGHCAPKTCHRRSLRLTAEIHSVDLFGNCNPELPSQDPRRGLRIPGRSLLTPKRILRVPRAVTCKVQQVDRSFHLPSRTSPVGPQGRPLSTGGRKRKKGRDTDARKPLESWTRQGSTERCANLEETDCSVRIAACLLLRVQPRQYGGQRL